MSMVTGLGLVREQRSYGLMKMSIPMEEKIILNSPQSRAWQRHQNLADTPLISSGGDILADLDAFSVDVDL